MKKTLTILASSILLLSCGEKYEKQIERNFNQFRTAALENNGAAVYDLVSDKTKSYFEKLKVSVLKADSANVASLKLLDKINILSLRIRMDQEDLMQMSDKEFLINYFENHYMEENSQIDIFKKFKLSNIHFSKDQQNGFAELRYGKKYFQERPILSFNKNGEVYKLNFASMLKFGELSVKQLIQQQGISEDDFVDLTITVHKSQSGKMFVNPWQPLIP